MFSPASKARLTDRDVGRFPGASLFDRIGRAVCRAGCLPRKELYESWEVARRARRIFRGGRIVDLCAGHGLLGQVMLVLDDSSPSALLVDPALPPSAGRIHTALLGEWPRLAGRVSLLACDLADVVLEASDVVVSCHACGALTDRILEQTVAARARVAVLPCCHALGSCDAGRLTGWIDGPLAIDVMRAVRLERCGYHVRTQVIPAAVTTRNRLLLGTPQQP